ncbi:hypothetical protein OIV83_003416 [Microbotryomycetes sp. JL201]|nr:hypothetical protein OIV83_003416 [Microbotryomycetes sp. JL201]
MHGDPNWPKGLAIRPITANDVKLNVGHYRAVPESGDDVDDVEQSVGEFGIAGRTWEAAIAMRMYLTPPNGCLSSSTLAFEPPCPLFDTHDVSERLQKGKRRRTVVEVGSGTGYLSLALAPWLESSDTIVMTDLDDVCPLLERNLDQARTRWRERRREACQVLVRPLPWGSSSALATLLDELEASQSFAADDSRHPVDVVLASDLIYFPFLYPCLLRTLIELTQPRRSRSAQESKAEAPTPSSPLVLFSYKVRSLTKETPFWAAFGRWFEFEPVLVAEYEEDNDGSEAEAERERPPTNGGTSDASLTNKLRLGPWQRFGVGDEDELFVFVCVRRQESFDWPVPDEDSELMSGGAGGGSGGDDQFERILLCSIDL